MGRTALDLTPEEWQAYRPGGKVAGPQVEERWERAWRVAQAAAEVLREQFGATRVVAFGSLAHRDAFTLWSDIDLAAWGISPGAFYRAVAVVTGISPEFKVDLVAPEDCPPTLRHVIERARITQRDYPSRATDFGTDVHFRPAHGMLENRDRQYAQRETSTGID